MKTAYEYWLEQNKEELAEMWDTMGIVEQHEEGGTFDEFCKSQFDQSDDVCPDCGNVPASGACFSCKMD